ncbi:MAG: AI-2E family transporter [Clostridiales bacterium]|jgi:predicted PurR-regulated permease PerM|nr:AI-2E family transporter [Eubacteriales bacterium]MDH7566560.1 AI-2E family transporter [Clostridiales bacterium]
MQFLHEIMKRDITRRIIVLSVLGLLLYIMRDMLNMFLLTFIFTFLLYSVQGFLVLKLKKIIQIKQKVMIVLLFLAFLAIIVFFLYNYMPVLVYESNIILKQTIHLYNNPEGNPIAEYIVAFIKQLDKAEYIGKGAGILFKSIKDISKIGFDLIVSLVLSLFFLLEKNRITNFVAGFKSSKIAVFYEEIQYFGKRFLDSFGKVLQAQVLIALLNSILSVIALAIMGFPYLPFIAAMIFILGLIPVAGVIISLIPLTILGFSVGGFNMVLYVLIMVVILHALESYFLNPKLYSYKTNLPVFFTFIVLIVSEHLIGVWGLVIGIPLFIFLLDLLDVKREDPKEKGLSSRDAGKEET